jgi:LVIVD repeat
LTLPPRQHSNFPDVFQQTVRTSAIATGSHPNGVTISGNFLYLANYSGGFRVYDIFDPAHPRDVCDESTSFGGFAAKIAITGNYCFVANESDGLRVWLLEPSLAIGLTSTNTVLLSWPGPPAPYIVLQQSSNLVGSNWLDLTNSPSVISNRNQIVVPASASSGFYRLKLH